MSKKVISFHYVLSDSTGNEIDKSDAGAPLSFLEGSGHIIPGLEKELLSMSVGEKKTVNVASSDAYGDPQADLIVTVKKDQFPNNGGDLKVDDMFQVDNHEQAPIFRVLEINEEDVKIDGNHPLAGTDLVFNVEVAEMREATEEEVAHGHAHGPGGHQH